ADMPDLADCQGPPFRPGHGSPVPVGGGDAGRLRPMAGPDEIVAGEHRKHACNLERRRRVYGAQQAMGGPAADETRTSLTGQVEVVRKGAAASDQAAVLQSEHGMPDAAWAFLSGSVEHPFGPMVAQDYSPGTCRAACPVETTSLCGGPRAWIASTTASPMS